MNDITLPLTGWYLFNSIGVVVLAVLAALWVALKYKAPGALGLAGVLLLVNHIMWWEWSWTTPVIVVATVGLFITGMLVNEDVDDWFHGSALFVSLFAKLLFVLAGTSVTFGSIPLWVIIVAVAILVVVTMAATVRLANRSKPATKPAS